MPNKCLTKLSDALPVASKDQIFFDDIANRFAKTAPKEESPKSAASEPKSLVRKQDGKLIRLPAKEPDDLLLRLEQNLGCELPVCVSNRRDVNQESIRVSIGEDTIWELTRLANSLLPAPEHYRVWLWLLDRLYEAAASGQKELPKIIVNPTEVHRVLPGKKSGSRYMELDEGLMRLAGLNITIKRKFYSPDGDFSEEGRGQYGALFTYASWRTTNAKNREALVDFKKGWIVPSQILWGSVLNGYVKAVFLQPLRQMNSYVAQRLMVYLSKHCKLGSVYKVSLAKLLPRIPMNCTYDETKRRLKPHHEALVAAGFLAREPVFDGRGSDLMVTYERTRQGY